MNLGKSGAAANTGTDFKTLVGDVAMGHVGATFSLEASRLARSNQDWHRLLERKRDFRCMLGESLRVDRNGAIRRAPIVAKRSCFRGQQVFWFGARSAKLNGIRSSISSSVGRRGNSARTWRSQS